VDLLLSGARTLTSLGAHADAQRALERARSFVDDVASGLSDAALRETFRTASEAHRELLERR
jgi:hypothetical protein